MRGARVGSARARCGAAVATAAAVAVAAAVGGAAALSTVPQAPVLPVQPCAPGGAAEGQAFCNASKTARERAAALADLLTPEEAAGLLTARRSPLGGVPRLGVPQYDFGGNCIHGVQSRCAPDGRCPTSFPSPNALGASFDEGLWAAMAEVIGTELRALWRQGVGENRASGLPPIGLDCWSPNINIARDPRWGRVMEVPSEDPLVNGRFGAVYSRGLQEGEDERYLRAVATLKHFAAYNLDDIPGTNITRFNFDARVSSFDLADSYLPAFEASIKDGKARSVMCSYNAINGVPACANKALLEDTLRGAWGFDGYVTSDSGAVAGIGPGPFGGKGGHSYAPDEAGAVKAALAAGTDINSDVNTQHSTSSPYLREIPPGVANGTIPMRDVKAALVNSLALRFELGLFDDITDQPYWHVPPGIVGAPEHVALSAKAAAASMVLVQNEGGVLPLKAATSLAIVGPHANATRALLGNYLGQQCPGGYGDVACLRGVGQEIAARNAGGAVTIAPIPVQDAPVAGELEAAVAAAAAADTVVLAMGLDTSVEREAHDRSTLELPGAQMELVRKVAALRGGADAEDSKPVVAVVLCGAPPALEELSSLVPGVLVGFYPGAQGAAAIADALFGKANPGGKLPFTFFKRGYVNESRPYGDMDMTAYPGKTYRYYRGDQRLWRFGAGLSYTSFALSSARFEGSANVGPGGIPSRAHWPDRSHGLLRGGSELEESRLRPGLTEAARVSESSRAKSLVVDVTNTGNVTGATVVQVYARPSETERLVSTGFSAAATLQRRLLAFRRVELAAGDATSVRFAISAADLRLVSDAGARTSVPGTFVLEVTDSGAGAADALSARVVVEATTS